MKKQRNDSYEQLAAIAAKYYGDRNCCTVIATAKACKVSYGKAFNACKREGRRTGHGTKPKVYLLAMASLGYFAGDIQSPLIGRTIGKAERYLPKKGTFLIHVRGHVAAYVDGKLHDWSSAEHSGKPRRHRITAIRKVTPLTDEDKSTAARFISKKYPDQPTPRLLVLKH
jgi:hypothetical protein|tara:strand:- start:166 stop:675 length:510 start_codon:yes stop_codon:yes gene_type:complete